MSLPIPNAVADQFAGMSSSADKNIARLARMALTEILRLEAEIKRLRARGDGDVGARPNDARVVRSLREQAKDSAAMKLTADLCALEPVNDEETAPELIRRDDVMALVTSWRMKWDAASKGSPSEVLMQEPPSVAMLQQARDEGLDAALDVVAKHAKAAQDEQDRLDKDGEEELSEQTDAALHMAGVIAEDIGMLKCEPRIEPPGVACPTPLDNVMKRLFDIAPPVPGEGAIDPEVTADRALAYMKHLRGLLREAYGVVQLSPNSLPKTSLLERMDRLLAGSASPVARPSEVAKAIEAITVSARTQMIRDEQSSLAGLIRWLDVKGAASTVCKWGDSPGITIRALIEQYRGEESGGARSGEKA